MLPQNFEKLLITFSIYVIAEQNVTRPSTFFAHWLLTLTFCKHCALPKTQQPFDLSPSCYDRIYGVSLRFYLHNLFRRD